MSNPLRVLILEDRLTDAELMLHELRRAGFEPAWQRVETEADYMTHLNPAPDIILADYTLPQFDAMRALRLLRERGLDTPFIVVTGSIGEEVAAECMKQGAADYLLKDRLARLGLAVTQALEQKRLRDDKRQTDAARARLIAILEATPDFVATADKDGRGIFLNHGGRKLIGFDENADISGFPLTEGHPEWARALVLNEAIPTAIRDGVWSGETALLSRDGREIPVSQVILAHKTPDGTVELLSTIARDITERKQAEKQIQRQLEQLDALHAIDLAITASLDLRAILTILVEHITARLQVDAAAVLLFNPRTQMLEYAAGHGFRTPAIQHAQLRLGDSYAGRAALERQMVRVSSEEVPQDLRVFSAMLADEAFADYVALPLVAKDQVKGVLEVFHRARLDPDRDWFNFLRTLATQAAIAIDNAQLFGETQRRAQQQEALYRFSSALARLTKSQELCEAAVHAGRDLLGFPYLGIFLLDPSTGARVLQAQSGWDAVPIQWRIPPGAGLSDQAVRTGEPQYWPDVTREPAYLPGLREARSELDVPIKIGDAVLGVLVVEDTRVDAFGADQVAVLQAVTDQLAVALEKARLFEQEQTRRAELAALYDLSRALADAPYDFDVILDLVVRRAVETIHVTFARIALLEGDEFVVRAAHPIRLFDRDLEVGRREPAAAHPFCQRVLEQNAPLVLRSDGRDGGTPPLLSDYERETLFLGLAQTLCLVPLRVGDRALGLLMLGEMRREEREPFTPEKLRLARSIGDQAASALRRAELFVELEQTYLQNGARARQRRGRQRHLHRGSRAAPRSDGARGRTRDGAEPARVGGLALRRHSARHRQDRRA